MNTKNVNWSKIVSEIIVGITGGVIFGILGFVIGSLIGIILIYRTSLQKNQYKKIIISSALSIIIFPLIIGMILFWPPFEDSDLLLALPVIPIFILISLIPSLLITSLLNWKQFLKNRIE